jgi:transcriptional regulator with XRE-family HTH domain
MLYIDDVESSLIIVECRRRAALTQRELAHRLDKHQSAIARWERGDVEPSLEMLRKIVEACGLELTFSISNLDRSDDYHLGFQLGMSVAERIADGTRRTNEMLALEAFVENARV